MEGRKKFVLKKRPASTASMSSLALNDPKPALGLSTSNTIQKKSKTEEPQETVLDVQTFGALTSLDPKLRMTLEVDMNYVKMTQVQSETMEPLLDGKDIHIQSKTGSGKTAGIFRHRLKLSLPRTIPSKDLDEKSRGSYVTSYLPH